MLDKVDALVHERHLLTHSFYTKWVAGTLPKEAMQEYARQYYAFESEFPRFLSAIHTQIEDRPNRQLVLENLWDEEYGPDNHAELWLRFADAVGVDRDDVINAEPNVATKALVETYREAAAESPAAGLAALYAYESQVPAVAQSKIDGLKAHYGIEGRPAVDFFTAHIEADTGHAAAERELVGSLASSEDEVVKAADRALTAWWDFLSAVDPE
jgi:pyrroloquinoline-quinone synthase